MPCPCRYNTAVITGRRIKVNTLYLVSFLIKENLHQFATE